MGFHTGQVNALIDGALDVTNPEQKYCLFGETIRAAARMESSSLPMKYDASQTIMMRLLDLKE